MKKKSDIRLIVEGIATGMSPSSEIRESGEAEFITKSDKVGYIAVIHGFSVVRDGDAMKIEPNGEDYYLYKSSMSTSSVGYHITRVKDAWPLMHYGAGSSALFESVAECVDAVKYYVHGLNSGNVTTRYDLAEVLVEVLQVKYSHSFEVLDHKKADF